MRYPAEKEAFLKYLKDVPIVQYACSRSGIPRANIYRWRKEDKGFRGRMDSALKAGRERMNDVAEGKLVKAVNDGEAWSVRYWLEHNNDRYRKRSAANKTVVQITRAELSDALTKIEPVLNQPRLKKKQYKGMLKLAEGLLPMAIQSGLIEEGDYENPLELFREFMRIEKKNEEERQLRKKK